MVTSARQEAILRHIARYAITLRPVLDKLFYDGEPNACDHDLTQLRSQKRISAVENAVPDPDNPHVCYSYYQLTKSGAKTIGASEHRGRAVGGQALARYLAFLWFCCIKQPRRHRLSAAHLSRIFGDEILPPADGKKRDLLLPGFHCLDKTEQSYRVLHLYAPKTNLGDTVTELRKRVREARAIPVVAQAIADRQYGFAILAETNEQRDALRTHLAKSMEDESVSVLVARSPGPWKHKPS